MTDKEIDKINILKEKVLQIYEELKRSYPNSIKTSLRSNFQTGISDIICIKNNIKVSFRIHNGFWTAKINGCIIKNESLGRLFDLTLSDFNYEFFSFYQDEPGFTCPEIENAIKSLEVLKADIITTRNCLGMFDEASHFLNIQLKQTEKDLANLDLSLEKIRQQHKDMRKYYGK